MINLLQRGREPIPRLGGREYVVGAATAACSISHGLSDEAGLPSNTLPIDRQLRVFTGVNAYISSIESRFV